MNRVIKHFYRLFTHSSSSLQYQWKLLLLLFSQRNEKQTDCLLTGLSCFTTVRGHAAAYLLRRPRLPRFPSGYRAVRVIIPGARRRLVKNISTDPSPDTLFRINNTDDKQRRPYRVLLLLPIKHRSWPAGPTCRYDFIIINRNPVVVFEFKI